MRGGLPPPSPLSGCIDGETEGDRLLGCPAPGSWPPERVLWLEVGGWRQADPLPDTQRSGALFFARCAPPAIHACCRGRSALAGWMRASARARRTGLLLPCLCSDPPSRPSLSLRRGRPSCFCASTLATTHHSSTLWCFGHRHEWSILPPACLAPAGHTRLVGLVQRGRGSRRDLCGGRGPYKMWRLLAAVRTLPCLFLRGGGASARRGTLLLVATMSLSTHPSLSERIHRRIGAWGGGGRRQPQRSSAAAGRRAHASRRRSVARRRAVVTTGASGWVPGNGRGSNFRHPPAPCPYPHSSFCLVPSCPALPASAFSFSQQHLTWMSRCAQYLQTNCINTSSSTAGLDVHTGVERMRWRYPTTVISWMGWLSSIRGSLTMQLPLAGHRTNPGPGPCP